MPIEKAVFTSWDEITKNVDLIEIEGEQVKWILRHITTIRELYDYLEVHGKWTKQPF